MPVVLQASIITAITVAMVSAGALGTLAYGELAPPNPSAMFSINAAGATFPFPLLDQWRVEYAKEYPNVNLNYQSIGSGGGIKQHIERTVNFAASDAPMRAAEADLAPSTLHIPVTLGAVTVAYNIPEIPESGLRLDGQTMAMIFLGEITSWNDERIAAHNPGVELPDADIVTVQRSDGSGTTFVFTDYLSAVSADFEAIVGKGKSVPWPGGVSSAGNEGVAGTIRTTSYSVGYVELAYAFQTGMSYASIQNADETAYIAPSIETTAAASAGASASLPLAAESWEGVSIVNAPGEISYPISSLSYVLLYDELGRVTDSLDEAHAVVHMLNWMLTSGQAHSESLLYVPLPEDITSIGTNALEFVTYNGRPVWSAAQASPDGAAPEGASQTMIEDTGSQGGGCLIATAAYGTEMAPQVQILRELRDTTLLGTPSGSAFMSAFNGVYYSFSPTVADLERQSPEFRGLVRALIAPMVSSLSIMSLAEPGSDSDVLALGIAVIALNVGMYIAAPAAIASCAWRRARR